jgi:integrase
MTDIGGFSDRFIACLRSAENAVQSDYFETEKKYRGLAIRVSKTGLKTWCFFYTWEGKRVRMSIGSYPSVSVKEAHKRAIEARSYLDECPPRDPRKEMAVNGTGAMTVAELVESYLQKRVQSKVQRKGDRQFENGLRNAKKIEGMLRRNIVPIIGPIKLTDLHARNMNQVMDSILGRGKKIAAARTFQTTRAMLNWAVSRGDLDRSPMEKMERPEDSAPRDRTLSPEEIFIFWHNLHKTFELESVQRILKLQLVIGQRVGEICGMALTELDLEKRRLWTIPAARSKNKHAHELPLPPLAVQIIHEALNHAGGSEVVFPNPRTGEACTSSAVISMVSGAFRKIGIAHFSSHDLRRTCADSMADLGVPDSIIGRVLNHRSVFKATVTQKHYITRSYEREMREALELWEARLRAIIIGEPVADVIPLFGESKPQQRG